MFGIEFMRLATSAALVIHLLSLASPTALAESCPERPYTQTEVALYTRSLRIAEALPPKPAGFEGGLGINVSPLVTIEQVPITTGFSSAIGVTTLSGNARSTSCVGLPAIGSIKFGVGYRTKTEVTYARPATEKWAIQSIGSSLTEEEAFSDRPPKAKLDIQHAQNLIYYTDRKVKVNIETNIGGSFPLYQQVCLGKLKTIAIAGADAYRCVIDPRAYQRPGNRTLFPPEDFNEQIFVLFGAKWKLKNPGRFSDPGKDNAEQGVLETALDDTPPRQRIYNIMLTISADSSRSDAVLEATNTVLLRQLIDPTK